MNTDELGSDLEAAAASWETPAFDVAELQSLVRTRRSRFRRRALASSLAILLLSGVGAAAAWIDAADQSGPQATHPSSDRHQSTQDRGLAPADLPPVRLEAVGGTTQRFGRQQVLARTPAATPVTVRARLSFPDNRRGQVRDTAIVIAEPGTEPAAAPEATGSYYRTTRVAISARVDATSPAHRILTVTTPPDLAPGAYPVLTVVKTVLLAGQKPGIHGPYEESSELGVIVITP